MTRKYKKAPSYTSAPLAERFAACVDLDGPTPKHRPELGRCHIWLAGFTGAGYGAVLTDEGKQMGAHVVAFLLKHGRCPIPQALHHCDNRACVNGDHIFEGTRDDNMRDAAAKGRMNRGEKNGGGGKLTETIVRAIFLSSDRGDEAAARYGISGAMVSLIRSRKKWGHVTVGLERP